jgi:hypothetical protein
MVAFLQNVPLVAVERYPMTSPKRLLEAILTG